MAADDLVKIVIPSHKRWETMTAHKAIVEPIVCVAESQQSQYAECLAGIEIVTHPDSVIGLGAATRTGTASE